MWLTAALRIRREACWATLLGSEPGHVSAASLQIHLLQRERRVASRCVATGGGGSVGFFAALSSSDGSVCEGR